MKKLLITLIIIGCMLLIGGCEKENTPFVTIDGHDSTTNSNDSSGTNNESSREIEFKLGYQKLYGAEIYIVNPNDPIDKVCDNPYEVTFASDNSEIDGYDCFLIYSLDELWQVFKIDGLFLSKYDSTYFSENAIIVCYFGTGTSDADVTATSVMVDNDELSIELFVQRGTMDMTSRGFIILEVKKAECNGVKKIAMSSKEEDAVLKEK